MNNMAKQRSIEEVISKPGRHWVGNGFYVHNYFPMGRNLMERFNPFFLLDYNEAMEFPGSRSPRGIGAHPHRGIETVSFSFQGAIEHHDNQGNHGIIWPGDVQWMTAGKGIMHKEYHEQGYREKGGIFHMVQLWVNLPASAKFTEPGYQAIPGETMGLFALPDGAGEIRVVAGTYQGVQGPARSFTPMNVLLGKLAPGGEAVLQEPGDWNLGILLTAGAGKVQGQDFAEGDFLLFANELGEVVLKGGEEGLSFLVLSGEPLHEPIAAGGEFVMNTREELEEAFEDRRQGRFGSLDF